MCNGQVGRMKWYGIILNLIVSRIMFQTQGVTLPPNEQHKHAENWHLKARTSEWIWILSRHSPQKHRWQRNWKYYHSQIQPFRFNNFKIRVHLSRSIILMDYVWRMKCDGQDLTDELPQTIFDGWNVTDKM